MLEDLNYALYYPTIEFENYEWLFLSALLWDKLNRIVPEGYTPCDPRNVKELVEQGDIGIYLNPEKYTKDVAIEFRERLEAGDWEASALAGITDEYPEYTKLHKSKVDVSLREMIISAGGLGSNKDWDFVPTNFAAQYMTYLANHMAMKNNLSVISDKPSAWACSTYFAYDGKVCESPDVPGSSQLASIVIKNFLPINFSTISPSELTKFRNSKKDERRNFIRAMKNCAQAISNCNDPKVINDLIHDLTIDVEESLKEYKSSMRDLKFTSLTGLYTIGVPIATEIFNKTSGIHSDEIMMLSAMGVGIGLITSIKDYKKAKKQMTLHSDYSYLLQMKNRWDNIYQGGSYSYFLSRQIEEFIND